MGRKSENRLKILFCQKTFNPTRGGVGKVTWILVRALRRLGVDAFVIATKNFGYSDENVTFMPSGNFDDSSENESFLSDFIRDNAIDVLINQEGLGRYGFDLFRKVCANKCALVSVVHSQPLGAVKNFIYSKRLKFQKYKLVWLLNLLWVRPLRDIVVFLYKLKYVGHFRKLCEFSDKVVLLSELHKSDIVEYLGRCPDNVVAIPNPIDISEPALNCKKKKQVLWVGRVDSGKRLDVFIKIWERLYSEFPDWEAFVLGDGVCLPAQKEYVQNRKIPRVNFMGFQPSKKYFDESEIYCATTSFEGFGMTILEAVLAKCVPVAFRTFDSIEDLILDGKNGFLVPPYDIEKYVGTMRRLMSDSELRESLRKNAECVSNRFDSGLIAKKWLDLFSQIVRR